MRDRRHRTALGLLVLLLGSTILLVPRAAAVADDVVTGTAVDDAVLRWGMSNEANNRAPDGTFNFFSAGSAAKPAGHLPAAAWRATQGAVSIQKWNGSAYQPATWAGLRTDAAGVEISSFTSGRFSGHQYVFSGGEGVVDAEAGTARITWTGTVSVLFYGGAVLFRITDPELDVRADGTGVLAGTISGVGSSRERPGESFEIEPQRVTLADLPAVGLGQDGFSAEPAYDGVTVTVAGRQVTDSFPQSFVSVMDQLGTAPFWHRSGGLIDEAKKALPVTVSFDAATPVPGPPPPTTTPNPAVENSAPPAPTVVTETRTVIRPAPPQTAPAAVPPPGAAPVVAAAAVATPVAETVLASSPRAAGTGSGTAALWWLGGGLFGLAVLVVAGALLLPVPAPVPAPGRDHA